MNSFWTRFAIFKQLALIILLGLSLPVLSASNVTNEPLTHIQITQLSPFLLRVTLTINSKLPTYKTYNLGVFSDRAALLTNCDNYVEYNGCYFPEVTTATTTNFLLAGEFGDNWQTNRYALIVVYSAPSPYSLINKPTASNSIAGIAYPLERVATIEYFPFGRISV